MNDFLEARNKLEAVARISTLTNSGPETLGPGSKEHKSVLINLAKGLKLNFDESLTKQDLGKFILESMGGSWSPSFESVGQTITLRGLNALLYQATRYLSERSIPLTNSQNDSFEEELKAISKIVVENTPLRMEGRDCVQEMREAEDNNWRQTEWQGFYFEMKVESALTNSIGGGRVKFENTAFDYARNFIWDLKVHSSENKKGKNSGGLILNDSRAIEEAVDLKGLGFIVLSAKPEYDIEFTRWHKKYRGSGDEEPRKVLKSRFTSQRLDIFYIPNLDRLEKAKSLYELAIIHQGKNSNSKPRPPKYGLDLLKARDSDLQVFSYDFN
jgi:hypothetical protein